MNKYEIFIKTPNRIFTVNKKPVRSPLKMIINESDLDYIKNKIKIEGLLENEYSIERYIEHIPIIEEEPLIIEKIKVVKKKVKVEKNLEQSKNEKPVKKKRGRPSKKSTKKTTLEKLLEE